MISPYCPVSSLRAYVGHEVVMCGLVVVTRILSQEDGGVPMLFWTLADRTGMVEAELFFGVYRRYGVLRENGKNCTLRRGSSGKTE